ncbi:MAG: IS200/IS605 family transposase [Armatimonadetes bacterium]|nr:IS200/IS605 family transposase [Armatimonadota bacterium]
MGTYHYLRVHIVFATQQRKPTITNPPELHAYLAGIVRGLKADPYAIGGVADHVHLLCGITPSHSISDFMRDLKKSSSIKMKQANPSFAWQEGYSVFSVHSENFESTRQYIQNQEEHHRKVNSRNELLALFKEFGIEPNMQYFE